MFHRIELHGSDTATWAATGLSVKRSKHGVIDVLARAMVDAGADPDVNVEIMRAGTLCFKPIPLKSWASRRLLESDNGGFSDVKFREDTRWQ